MGGRQVKSRQDTAGGRNPREAAEAMARLVRGVEAEREAMPGQRGARKRKASMVGGGRARRRREEAVRALTSWAGVTATRGDAQEGAVGLGARLEEDGLGSGQGVAGAVPPSGKAASDERAGQVGGEQRSGGGGAVGHEEAPGARSARAAGGPRVVVGLGHKMIRTGTVLWCHKCGAHAEERVGSALSRGCRPVQEGEKSGRASRRRLLLQGRHPVTKKQMDAS